MGARPLLLEPCHELLEAQLLEPLTDRLELARAELDEPAALAHELEGLAQPGLSGVQALDDRLQPRGGGLVGLLLVSHRPRWSHRRRRRRSTAGPRAPGAPPRRSSARAPAGRRRPRSRARPRARGRARRGPA